VIRVAALLAAIPAIPAAAANWRHYGVADPAATLRRVNVLRAQLEAPALTLVPEWSDGCAKHIAYTRRHPFGHSETPGAPGYTPDGALAGATSVLFTPPQEPFPKGDRLGAWADAPYHQIQVLDPRLARTGVSLGCMSTLAGLPAPGSAPSGLPPRLLAWPGNGTRNVPRTINACSELPANPFTAVGWSCGGVGTAAYVYALDPVSGACADTAGAPPQVALTAKGRTIPLQVVPGTDCGWIVITGRALPGGASVRMDVTLAGSTLTHAFSTERVRTHKRER
jgi:hypothetical protein